MRSIERRREQVLNQILDTLGVPTSGPVHGLKYHVRKSAIDLVSEKRMTRNILDRLEELMLNVNSMFAE